MYWPLRALSTGLFRAVPAMPESPLDIVSIDYVADAIYELCECPQNSTHKTFHLTASEDASTFAEINPLAARLLPPAGAAGRATRGVRRRCMSTLCDAAIEASRIYFPYFAIATRFDKRTRTRAGWRRWGSTARRCASADPHHLLDFATRSRWGKQPDRGALTRLVG